MPQQVASLFGVIKVKDEFTPALRRIKGDVNRTTGVMAAGFAGMAVAVAAAAASIATIGVASVRAATKFETAFVDVRKTVNATEAEFASLRKGLREMATDRTNPVAGLDNALLTITNIASQAGQLGIAVEDIQAFTQVMGELTIAAPSLGADASINFARFISIMNDVDTSNARDLADVIVNLGNNLPVFEDQILKIATNISGTANSLGFSANETLVFASALGSVSVEAEVANTLLFKLSKQMLDASKEGRESLRTFAEITGMTPDAFSQSIQNNPFEAVVAFIQGLEGMDAGSVNDLLDSIGVADQRIIRDLNKAVGGIDRFNEAIALSGESAENALGVEAQKRLDTTAAKWNVLKNNVNDIFITIGDKLLPIVNTFLGGILDVGAAIGRWFPSFSEVADFLENTFPRTFATIRGEWLKIEPDFNRVVAIFELVLKPAIQDIIDNILPEFGRILEEDIIPVLDQTGGMIVRNITPHIRNALQFASRLMLEFDKYKGAIISTGNAISKFIVATLQESWRLAQGSVIFVETWGKTIKRDVQTAYRTTNDLIETGNTKTRETINLIISKLNGNAMPTLIGAWITVRSVAGGVLNNIIRPMEGAIVTLIGLLEGPMKTAWNAIETAMRPVVDGLSNTVSFLSTITGALGLSGSSSSTFGLGGSSSSGGKFGVFTSVADSLRNQATASLRPTVSGSFGTSRTYVSGGAGGSGGFTGTVGGVIPAGVQNAITSGSFGTFSRDSGGFAAAGSVNTIGKGVDSEMFVPQRSGTFVRGGGSPTFNININAPMTREQAFEATSGAMDALQRRLRSQGAATVGILG